MKEERVKRVLQELAQMKLSQMLLVDPMSIYYLTGVYVAPFERFYGLYLRADGKRVFFLNKLFAVPEDVGIEKVWYSDTDAVIDMVAKYLDTESPLGVDKDLRAEFLLPLMQKMTSGAVINASLAVDLTRGVKDLEEQEKMRVSSAINDAAMERFRGLIHEGVTEREVAEQMLSIYRELGADGFSFEPLVAFGVNAADPHHAPDDTVVKPGDAVLFDVGCIKDGYCSDMTRTFYFQEVKKAHQMIYDIVRKANEKAIAKVRPGVPLCELDKTARDVITEAGYGPYFTHRLGHFIGLSEHEYGDVSSTNTRKAKAGMIFSIEPGIYLAGDTGVRIEDLVLVTENGDRKSVV